MQLRTAGEKPHVSKWRLEAVGRDAGGDGVLGQESPLLFEREVRGNREGPAFLNSSKRRIPRRRTRRRRLGEEVLCFLSSAVDPPVIGPHIELNRPLVVTSNGLVRTVSSTDRSEDLHANVFRFFVLPEPQHLPPKVAQRI